MFDGIRKLYLGDFNNMSQEPQPDGSIVVTLTTHGEAKVYRFRVRDLYGLNEEVLEEEVIEAGPPQFIRDRMEEARKQKRGKR